jgi:hypothetical protein
MHGTMSLKFNIRDLKSTVLYLILEDSVAFTIILASDVTPYITVGIKPYLRARGGAVA